MVLVTALHFVNQLVEWVGKGCHLFMDMPNTSKCCILHQMISRLREHRNVMLFIDIPDTSKRCIVHQAISREKKGL